MAVIKDAKVRRSRGRRIVYGVTAIVFPVVATSCFFLTTGEPKKTGPSPTPLANGARLAPSDVAASPVDSLAERGENSKTEVTKNVTNADITDATFALDELHTALLESMMVDSAIDLLEFEANLKVSLKGGCQPPWSNLAPKLTSEEIKSMSTEELTEACFSSGLPARTLLLYTDPRYAVKRLEILYPSYGELFAREDAWRIVPAALALHARQLDPNGPSKDNVNAFMGMVTTLNFYRVKGFGNRFLGHEREMVAAHVNTLVKIREYYRAVAENEAIGKGKQYVCPRTPVLVADWALVLLREASPDDYEKMIVVVTRARAGLSRNPTRQDVMSYVDAVLAELNKYLQTPK